MCHSGGSGEEGYETKGLLSDPEPALRLGREKGKGTVVSP